MSYVLTETIGHTWLITINRPQAVNILNIEVLEELRHAITQAVSADARAIVLTGAGDRAFVAGADVKQMSTMTQSEAIAFSRLGQSVFRLLERAPMPVIAAVGGVAIGGGCELALACDLRIASTGAAFAQPEVCLGITAGFGGTQRLARLIGPGAAKELLFTGRRIDANEALAIGLVNSVVPAEELRGAALELAETIGRNAPLAVQATKRSINLGLQTDIDTALEIEVSWFAACFETQDQVMATTAFVEHRQPEPFEGK